MSRILFLILSFLDFVAFVVRTLIFPWNQINCAISSTNVAILLLLFKQATIAPNKLIGSLQTSQKENNNRIPCTLTFHPHNHAVKSIILKNIKLLQNDPDTGRIFSQPPLISLKHDKNIGNFLVGSAFQTSNQPGTFKCARARCKTCPFICNVEKLSGPKRSIKITDHFTCTSTNVIYCTTLCKKLYTGETGRRLGDRFREHFRDVEKDDKNSSKPVARHFNLPNHSKQHMIVCGLSLHQGSSESRKTLEQKFIFFKSALLSTQLIKPKLSKHKLACSVPEGSVFGPILYSMYMTLIADFIKRHGMGYHFYADDAYFPFVNKRCHF